MDKKNKKEKDVLDEVKQAEKMIKRRLLLKTLPELKRMAREVLELKEKATLLLAEVGVEDKDIKRVIDFINSLPEIQLSEQDIKELAESMKKKNKETREDVEEELENHPGFFDSGNAYRVSAGDSTQALSTQSTSPDLNSSITLSSNGVSDVNFKL